MLTYTTALHQLIQHLLPIYDRREAAAIADQYLTHLTGTDKLKRIVEHDTPLTPIQLADYSQTKEDLGAGKPLQYIIGTTWFMGHQFMVNEHVLIPRPETEELVDWVIKDNKDRENLTIVDIGTGSGCIAISLKLGLSSLAGNRTLDLLIKSQLPHPEIEVSAFDISPEALQQATKNAQNLQADVTFRQLDILDINQWNTAGMFDIIVSNPPYIPTSEKANMHTNVKDHEPSLALFVPNEDPLLFYKAIAQYGKTHLKENGAIYCELHKDHAQQTAEMFTQEGYKSVELREDMNGNPRMLKATL